MVNRQLLRRGSSGKIFPKRLALSLLLRRGSEMAQSLLDATTVRHSGFFISSQCVKLSLCGVQQLGRSVWPAAEFFGELSLFDIGCFA
jgi:hypothetical protein